MTKFRIVLCAAAAALLSAGASQAQNLIANGDFETGNLSPWSVSGGIVNSTEGDYVSCCSFTTSHPGNHVAALGAGFGTGTEILSQSFATVAGQHYYLNYDWAFIGGQANSLDVSLAGVTHSFCCSGTDNIDAAYSHDGFGFIGDGGVATLSFLVNDDPNDSTDTIIDNVNVHGVPEPATWALMLGGFGMAGAALRRRRALAA